MARGAVYVVNDGEFWAVKRPNAERASARFDTEEEVIERARELGRG
ncbi:MAG: DUF2188 domain-containing protein [Terriglobales bacterium]